MLLWPQDVITLLLDILTNGRAHRCRARVPRRRQTQTLRLGLFFSHGLRFGLEADARPAPVVLQYNYTRAILLYGLNHTYVVVYLL